MADSTSYPTKPHFPIYQFTSQIPQKPINKGKSCSSFLLKSLFFAIFIVVIPLFPSQAPEFFNQSLITKFWELLHLLFIGIAVAYGLFSRRNLGHESDMETHHSVDNTPNYVSKMFPVSSIFEDECEIPCGYNEKRVMHCWNSQNFEGGQGFVCSNGSTVGVFDEQYKPQLPISSDNFVDSVRYDGNGTNVVQAWNSDYHHSEPTVVVAQPYYTIGDYGEVVGYKPLGLPIRSLRSVTKELDSPKYNNESDSSSGSRGSSRSSHKSRDREFGDLSPSNLEQKFNDAAGSSSPIPWHSRSRRMEREKNHGNVTRPLHFRPLSVDETKFEALSSRSLQSTASFSSHNSVYSSLDSMSSDNMNLQEEDIGQKKSSYVPASENMNFREEEMGRKKASYVPASENMNFQEDMGQKKTSYVPASEDMNFQEEDLGKQKNSQGSSLRYGRVASRGKHAAVSYHSHFRPLSVDETQFESLGSQSFQSKGSFSSWTSYSSLDSVSSENMNFQKEDLGTKKSSHASSSCSPSPPATRIRETSKQSFHARGYSIGTLLQDDMKSNLKDEVRGLNGIGGEDPKDDKESVMHALQSDSEKPACLAKVPSKGKSVRTRRATVLISETLKTGEISSKQTDETVEKFDKKPDNVESVLMRKDKMKSGGPEIQLKGISKKNMDAYCLKPEIMSSNHCKRDMQETSKTVPKEDADIELESVQVRSDEDVVSECVNDSGLDSEVDKKASEFIAKFKEQIRLQKTGSIEKSKGQKNVGDHIR